MMSNIKLTAIDSDSLPWEERPNEKVGRSLYRKNLIVDPETAWRSDWSDTQPAQ